MIPTFVIKQNSILFELQKLSFILHHKNLIKLFFLS